VGVPANEVSVTINGPVVVTLNDVDAADPGYFLRNTPELLAPPEPEQTRTKRQAGHGIRASLPYYGERTFPFAGEILGSSQADRKTKEDALRRCLGLSAVQSFSGDDGFRLVEITDEDGVTKQTYACIASKLNFAVLDDADPCRRGFDFVMLAKDSFLYSQTLQSETGDETYEGTNFTVVQGVSPTVPFSLYAVTGESVTCDNGGTADASPIITITGASTSPKVTNATTGLYIELDGLELDAAETVVIDVANHTVELADGTDVSGYWASGSTWWVLTPGENDITLLDATPSGLEATLEVEWRNTYV
jgi:hypothetical protein